MKLESVTPAHLAAHAKSAMNRGDPRQPAFTLILGAGFSYGLVPLTRDMMHAEIGPCLRGEPEGLAPARKRELTIEFWHEFNALNQANATGCQVDLGDDGLPTDCTAAYQTVSRARAIGGIGTVREARDFLRTMIAKSRGRLNGAHFFLAALLDAQRRGNLHGKRPFCRTIFTTNFDSLLQTSLQLMGVLYYMTDRPELPLEPGHLVEDDEAIHLVYTHGSVHRPYLANTEEELKHLRVSNAPIFAPYLQDHGVIVVGYSGWHDTLVAALGRCINFAGNLYWCDVFSTPDAPGRLSRYARKLMGSERGRRFYVPLGPEGADGLMGLLFQELVQEGIPRLLIDPFVGLADLLSGLSVEGLTLKRYAAGIAPETSRPGTPKVHAEEKVRAKDLLEKAVDALRSASWGLKTEGSGTSEGKPDVAGYLISAALERSFAGHLDEAMALWTTAIELPGTPPEQIAKALNNRGLAYGQRGDTAREIADYTRVIELPGAPPDQVARALHNRGLTFGQQGDTEREIADYTRAVELAGAPPDLVASAFFNRGVTYGQRGNTEDAIADYTRAIELPGAPPDEIARALNNRGLTCGERGDTEGEIADYTRAIDLPGAPPDQIASALYNRGAARGEQGDTEKAIADYTRAIELPGAPPDEVARALNNRGLAYGQLGDREREIADYTRAIELPGAPPEQISSALFNRGVAYGELDDTEKAIADYTRAIELPGATPDHVASALNNRGLIHGQAGDTAREIADYTRAIELAGAPPDQVASALFNRGSAHGEGDDAEGAIADYTRAIELPGAPPDEVARALNNRGLAYGELDDTEREIADYTRAIELPGAPPDQVAAALNNRGATYGEREDTERAIADYTRVIHLPGAPPDEVAGALNCRGELRYAGGDRLAFLADLEASVRLVASPASLSNLGLAHCFAGNDDDALDAYRRFMETSHSAEDLGSARAALTAATASWLTAERAAPILARLESSPA